MPRLGEGFIELDIDMIYLKRILLDIMQTKYCGRITKLDNSLNNNIFWVYFNKFTDLCAFSFENIKKSNSAMIIP